MKVHIIFVLSVVGLSSARYVKWSPSDVDGHQDFKEDFHQFWSHLGDLLAEQDEQDLKEFLHQAFQMHRPIHDENNFNHNMVKPNRPYHHNSRPSYNDQENIMRPLHHEDFDTASQEVIDEEIVRPSSYLRDVEMEMNNAKQPLPQRPLRPFHNHPDQFDEDKYVMRPLHDLLAEIDGEMEQSLPENHIMRPLGPVEIEEEMDNVMRPLPQKPLRPLPNRPDEIDEEKYVMRPLQDLSAEIDREMEQSLPQNHIMRPLGPVEIEEMQCHATITRSSS
ncbi:uncharacterized protein LOC119066152 isoform X2 [Bradysia coprophila]|uniref:uncharacterized protein LOC119066152 isoform X2 n=1 Tax=Bradysia coprophila TaxID=38358 RepID=UPI00187D81B0|nr:uncharacterized protein LOC119066152 isoform X2 [Bradysia coprophila]